MALVRADIILSAINCIGQIVVATSDSTGGSSGQDSVLAIVAATIDQSNGLLYLWGLSNFISDSSILWSGRWGMIHHTRTNKLRNTKLEITFRSHWPHIINKSRRFAKLDWTAPRSDLSDANITGTSRLVVRLDLLHIALVSLASH